MAQTKLIDSDVSTDLMQSAQLTTVSGNVLHLFYNGETGLVVLDLVHKNEQGGHELVRQKIDEKKLLKHCR